MISNLTFKQENTIKDEPMVDLLKYLNNMLDTAVANARLPSGQNPLQQLVLILADGRFIEKVPPMSHLSHEFYQTANILAWYRHPRTFYIFYYQWQENLKRCVRDFLSQKRMVAFLLLDSPQESIMDLQVFPCSITISSHCIFLL